MNNHWEKAIILLWLNAGWCYSVNLVIYVTPSFFFIFLQTVVTMINQAIGASGVVSQECKAVVQQYGQSILDLLLAEVNYSCTLNIIILSKLAINLL